MEGKTAKRCICRVPVYLCVCFKSCPLSALPWRCLYDTWLEALFPFHIPYYHLPVLPANLSGFSQTFSFNESIALDTESHRITE